MQDDSDRVDGDSKKSVRVGISDVLGDYALGSTSSKRVSSLAEVDDDTRSVMKDIGIADDESGRSGSIMFINNGLSHCSNKIQDGVEILSTHEALKRYEWVKDYFWKATPSEKDEFTEKVYDGCADGYFIWVKPGYKIKDPVQACNIISVKRSVQTLHNIVIVEEGASLEMISGCATNSHVNEALHIGVSEIYVGKNASCTFSMIHNWGSKTTVRPRTVCLVEAGGKYVSNYVLLKPVGTLQSFPLCRLNGEGASCKFNTICIACKGSDIDSGTVVELNAPNTSAEVVSRNIVRGGNIIARGRLIGNTPGIRAHLECKSIMLDDGGKTEAIPELISTAVNVEMTHEAAVGKIARDQIEYLMSRGLSEEDAIGMIIRGFLVGGISGLSDNLKKEIDDAISKADLGS
ncbi:MAG: SufD family Fe-S cluster assembly protein [archaeon]|nr:SufD family Fe-S cluster assembly protein [archaeon]